MFAFKKCDPSEVAYWGMALPSTFQPPAPGDEMTVVLAASYPAQAKVNAGDVVFGVTGVSVVLAGEVLRMVDQPATDVALSVATAAVTVRVLPYDLAALEDLKHEHVRFYETLRYRLLDEVEEVCQHGGGLSNVAWPLGYSSVGWDIHEEMAAVAEKG